jgi:hypothetical protein
MKAPTIPRMVVRIKRGARCARIHPARRQGHLPARAQASMGGKWLELLSEIAPGLKRAAIMFNPETAPITAADKI